MGKRIIIMFDGAFVIKHLEKKYREFPGASNIESLSRQIFSTLREHGKELLRVYFYDAPPYMEKQNHPVTGEEWDFSSSMMAAQREGLQQSLEMKPNFAVRRGHCEFRGWKLSEKAFSALTSGRKLEKLKAEWIEPNFEQKGVDMRIGLDIALIALKRLADAIVLVTGDADFVPAMKFARREGIRVYLETLGEPVNRRLRIHADVVLNVTKRTV